MATLGVRMDPGGRMSRPGTLSSSKEDAGPERDYPPFPGSSRPGEEGPTYLTPASFSRSSMLRAVSTRRTNSDRYPSGSSPTAPLASAATSARV